MDFVLTHNAISHYYTIFSATILVITSMVPERKVIALVHNRGQINIGDRIIFAGKRDVVKTPRSRENKFSPLC